MMKRIVSISLLILSVSFAFGQKRSVTSCWSYLDDGFLGDALESIEQASEHPKTADWYKTWWYYGQTYQALATTDKEKYQKLCDSCANKAFEAYIKSIKLNFEDPEIKELDLESEVGAIKFIKAVIGNVRNNEPKVEDQRAIIDIIQVRFPALANGFVNNGIKLFQQKEYAQALEQFEKSLTISSLALKADTAVIYYASLAAINAEDWEKTKDYCKTLKQLDYGNKPAEKVLIALNLAKAYKHTGDTAKYISTLEAGREEYPESSYDIVIELFNHYIDKEDYEKAHKYISLAIEANPEEASFYVVRGTLNEEMDNIEGAISDYKQAIVLNPDNFDANYSLGAYYYNYAADTLAWANENIPPTEVQKYQKVQEKAKEYFKKAKPYLEQARAIKNDDINVLRTIRTIYYKLEENEKYEEVDSTLKELTE
ncbi:MAG: tetratricopeptide repeat protein [Candidatus Delongbacteria bacterium]|nr:tetratricopeptide repeat protein [Candidatus Delongbacteria bacterium]